MLVNAVVTADGKLLVVRVGNLSYMFTTLEDSGDWEYYASTENVADFTTAAGGAETVQGTENTGVITFNYNGVTYVFNDSAITPDVVGEWQQPSTVFYIDSNSGKIGVDANGRVITADDGDTVLLNSYENRWRFGGTDETIEAVIQENGAISIEYTEDEQNYQFTVGGVEYNIVNGVSTPDITEYQS